jgi:hypothetical protein
MSTQNKLGAFLKNPFHPARHVDAWIWFQALLGKPSPMPSKPNFPSNWNLWRGYLHIEKLPITLQEPVEITGCIFARLPCFGCPEPGQFVDLWVSNTFREKNKHIISRSFIIIYI